MYEPPDPDSTEEEKIIINKLSSEELKNIDKALISNTDSKYYRKVARVIGTTMQEYPELAKGVSDVFYSQRIKQLVKDGYLESQGNLNYMRFSEVKLTQKEIK